MQKKDATMESDFIRIFNNTFMTDKEVLAKFKPNEEKEQPENSDEE